METSARAPRSAAHRRPTVAGEQAARLGIDVVAIATHQRPFARLDADRVQQFRAQPQLVELAHGVGLQVDAHAQRLQLGHRLEDDAGHTDLVQRQRQRHAADPTSGDQYRLGV